MSGSNSSAPGWPASEPLEMTVHSLPDAARAASLQRVQGERRKGRWKMVLVLLVCAAPVIASYFTYFVIRPQGRTNYSTLIQPTRAMPAGLPLHALEGQPVVPATLKGQWLLVAVGPGACSGACEQRLFMQRQLREMMGKDRDRIDKLWLVTDNAPVPPALRDALANPPTTVLRTSPEALSRWLAPAPGHALEDSLYIVDPMGEWMMRAPPNPDPAKLKRDLERLLRASAGWDTAGR